MTASQSCFGGFGTRRPAFPRRHCPNLSAFHRQVVRCESWKPEDLEPKTELQPRLGEGDEFGLEEKVHSLRTYDYEYDDDDEDYSDEEDDESDEGGDYVEDDDDDDGAQDGDEQDEDDHEGIDEQVDNRSPARSKASLKKVFSQRKNLPQRKTFSQRKKFASRSRFSPRKNISPKRPSRRRRCEFVFILKLQ